MNPFATASQVPEKCVPKDFIPNEGIKRIVDTLIGSNEEDKLSRIVGHAVFNKNEYRISPSRYIHTSNAETYRPIAVIVEELKGMEANTSETDQVYKTILEMIRE